MATPRLPFLYPNLMRAIRSCEPRTYRPGRIHGFHSTRGRKQEVFQRRYGPAVEPNIPPPSRPRKGLEGQSEDVAPTEKEVVTNADHEDPPEQPQSQDQQSQSPPQDTQQETTDASHSSSPNPEATEEPGSRDVSVESEPHDEQVVENIDGLNNDFAATAPYPTGGVGEERSQPSPYVNQGAFDDVLHMPSPTAYLTPTGPSSDKRPPHLTPGPYVHHFDTYSLVRDLSKGDFTDPQSTTIMKAVRSILQNNLDFAKQSLTSKSDVENELYLFKAACSELQSSLQTARNSEVQRQRASRTQLQHEIDILSQRLNQELAGMKDDIKGMFNDHSMTTREQQRSIDTSVQELNYKITVSLNSDGKSEIEGLRWILTRRAALTVATCAFMIIVFLKYASVRKVQDSPKKVTEVEKPVTKEVTTETRIVHDAGAQANVPSIPEAHLGESLG
ncbi:Protein of unknown function DUF1640 [Penicillium alfredii]|uniref:MOZ protein represents a chromatin-associated acetyltransferase n=1 Tax=Penicillium alfredii TaxID=1506179 RepID=A0A9W9F2P9_9EURO|nr:Protein of unknown function DUF1640 [Penicillium alfredii]KAJ5092380.1 Protein of unknown function DUF1640 [Penicillium alfredii]